MSPISMDKPLTISIVTICFNNLPQLKESMASVAAQERLPHSHWIIDGSTNGDIRNYLTHKSLPGYVKWISEPDKGISDAFNKGIARAEGDIIHLLNSGDSYHGPQTLATVMAHFESHPHITWLHGKYCQYMGGRWIVSGKRFDPKRLYQGMREVAHPTMFLRREVYQRVGVFPAHMKLAMDYDFLIRLRHEPFDYLDTVLSVFAPGGTSDIHWQQSHRECMRIYRRHLGPDPRLWLGYAKQVLVHAVVDSPLGRLALHHRKAD